jgi:hypothetical protein
MEERQAQWLDDLHEMVLFMHGHPEAVPAFGNVQATLFADSAEDMIDRVHSIGGHWEAHTDSPYFNLTKRFGKHRIVLAVRFEKVSDDGTVPAALLALAEPLPSEVVPPDFTGDPF